MYQIIITGVASFVIIAMTDTTVPAHAVDPTKKEALRGYPMVYFEGEYFTDNKRIHRCKEIKIFAIVAPKILEGIGLTLPPPVLPEWNATPQIERQIDYCQGSCLSKLHLDPMQANKLERLAEQFIMGELTAYEVDQQLLSLRGGYTQLELVVAAFVYFLKIYGGSSQAEAFSQAAMASRAAMGISAHNSLHRLNQDGNRNPNFEGNRNGNCQTRKLKASNEEYSTNSNSEYEEIQSFKITTKGVNRSITQSDYERLSVDRRVAKEKYVEEWVENIQQSQERYKLTSYKSEPTTAFINKEINQETGKLKIEASFINNKSREAMIRTQLSPQEYQNLKRSATEKTEFLLTDLNRDPQTGAKNEKSAKELDIIQDAAKKGLVNMQDIRRPIEHKNEKAGDFINSQTGEIYEIKSITQFVSPSGKVVTSFKKSASNIADRIIESQSERRKEPVPDKYIVNAKEVPKFKQHEYIDQIQEQLKKANVLNKINLTFLHD